MSDIDNNPDDTSVGSDPVGDYKEYTGPTQAEEKPKTETDADSKFGTEILSILERFGEEIKHLSKSVDEYIDKKSFGKAAESVRDALGDAGEGIKRTTQNVGDKLEEERIQRAIRDLKDYAKKTGKSVSDLFADETTPKDSAKSEAESAAAPDESPESGSEDTAENDMNYENTFGG